MASAIIHIAVAKELEKALKIKNTYNYYLGSIAPDLAKQIGRTKEESHFLFNSYKPGVPNLKMFLNKYPDFRKNEFDLGYFIHLFTDMEWEDGFIDKLIDKDCIKLLDGTTLQTTRDEIQQLIYSDFTNLNIKLIEAYNIDLSLFYEEFKEPKTKIEEIPADKLDILINKMGILIANSKEDKTYTFDIYSIKDFISKTVSDIKKELML